MSSDLRKLFAKNLDGYRKDCNYTWDDLAESSGISRRTLLNYAGKKTVPDLDNLGKLAKALVTEPYALLVETDFSKLEKRTKVSK